MRRLIVFSSRRIHSKQPFPHRLASSSAFESFHRSNDEGLASNQSLHQSLIQGRPHLHDKARRRGHRPPSLTPHVTNDWELATRELIQLSEWKPGHKRKAQQCLQHWSRPQTPQLSDNNSILLQLWSLVQKRVPSQETSAAMYDYGVLALSKHGLVDKALQAFEEFITKDFRYVSAVNRHFPNSYHLNAVLHALSRSEQPERAQRLLMRMYDDNIMQPNAYSVTSVIDGFSRTGQGQRAQDLLNECLHRGLDATVACYNAVLSAWSRDRHAKDAPERATQVLMSMPVPKDSMTWSSYLRACRDPAKMESVLWKAYQQGEPINVFCFNIVLDALGKSGEAYRAEKFLTKWIQLVADNKDIPKDLWPKASTFNAVLNAMAKKGDCERVRFWLREMQRMGSKPTGLSYNCLIDALARIGNVSEAIQVWQEQGENMSSKDTEYACNSILSAWANCARQGDAPKKEVVGSAFAFVERMKNERIRPSLVTYNALLKVVSACEEPALTEKVFSQMASSRIEPDIVSYSCAIDAYAKVGMPEEAYKIHQNMKVKPTTDSFNSLIHAFSKAKNPEAVEAAESIFNEMTIANVNKDLITYCTMLACWSHTSHPDKAQRARNVLDQLKSTFQSLALKLPGASEVLRNAHTMVLAACAHLPHHSGQTEQALRIAHVTFSEVENPNHITYATYIQSVSRLEKDVERKKESAKSIFLRYCEEEKEEISPLLLRKLEAILSSKEYEDVVTLGRNLQRQDQ